MPTHIELMGGEFVMIYRSERLGTVLKVFRDPDSAGVLWLVTFRPEFPNRWTELCVDANALEELIAILHRSP